MDVFRYSFEAVSGEVEYLKVRQSAEALGKTTQTRLADLKQPTKRGWLSRCMPATSMQI